MATIKPFVCVRPALGRAEEIAALPYDVYKRAEAAEAVVGKPYSFLRIDRGETNFFDETMDIYADSVYDKAKELFVQLQEQGLFITDAEAGYYIYELTMKGRSQTGIVACASIDDYLDNRIKKHEHTRVEKELDRIRHIDTLCAQTGPIFLAYRANDVINTVVAKTKQLASIYDFIAEDRVRHRVWKIADTKDVEAVYTAFSAIDSIYIADGHHRAASAVKVGLKRREAHPDYNGTEEFNYFLSVLFPDEELMIMDYNRVLQDLNGYTLEEFFEQVGKSFDVEPWGAKPYRPQTKGEFGLYVENNWYRLTAKAHTRSTDPVKGLDVAILQDYFLTEVLGINDPTRDLRIDFVGGIRGLEELERRAQTDMKLAVAMYPTSIGELFAVADADQLMPPKSTWFEPKLRSGLFIHKFEQ